MFMLPFALAPLPPDSSLLMWTQGDEELDNWVRDTYGDEYDRVLLSEMNTKDQHSAHQLLPAFRVGDGAMVFLRLCYSWS